MPDLVVRLGSLIEDGAERLRRAQLPEARREALRIWNQLSQSSAADTLLRPDIEIEPAAVDRYQRSIVRRSAGEPLPHVTGWVGFRQMVLRSDSRALIPRPETEGLVDLLLGRVRSGRVADIGTGTGCIALSLALEGGFEQVVAVDCSPEALRLAELNRRSTGARLDLVQADLCSALRPESFDALISNPPYLTAAEYRDLDGSVRDWEPEIALVSGNDGLEATGKLLEQGRAVLRPGGWLAVEVDCTRASSAAQVATALGWEDVSIQVDLFGRERYLLARRSYTT